MIKLVIYLILLGATLYLLAYWSRRQQGSIPAPQDSGGQLKAGKWFRPRRNPGEIWIQVYETASLDEGRALQARLQEDEIECILYEQGKKDIHGNSLKGIGVAVPKTAAAQAQRIISRMPA